MTDPRKAATDALIVAFSELYPAEEFVHIRFSEEADAEDFIEVQTEHVTLRASIGSDDDDLCFYVYDPDFIVPDDKAPADFHHITVHVPITWFD